MNKGVKINQLKAEFDYVKLGEEYEVFKIESSEKVLRYDSRLFDVVINRGERNSDENKVLSVKYENGRAFWVLLEKRDGNLNFLKNILREEDTLKFENQKIDSVPDNVLLQLLFNSLACSTSDCIVCNLTGKLYISVPSWKRNFPGNKGKEIPDQVWTLEVYLDRGMYMSLNLATFSSERIKDRIFFKKGKNFYSYPQYERVNNSFLRRKLTKDSGGSAYIKRQITGEKNRADYLNLWALGAFEYTKLGVLHTFLERFKFIYGDKVKLSFVEIPSDQVKRFEIDRKVKKAGREILRNLFKENPIKVIDGIKTEESRNLCEDIVKVLNAPKSTTLKNRGFDTLTAELIDESCDGAPCLRLVHEKDWYKEEPKSDDYDTSLLYGQHMAMEEIAHDIEGWKRDLNRKLASIGEERKKKNDYYPSTPNILITCCQELLIKRDLRERRIKCFDWEGQHFEDDLVFVQDLSNISGLGYDEKDCYSDSFCIMKITPLGEFSLGIVKYDAMKNEEAPHSYIKIWREYEFMKRVPQGMIIKGEDINVIFETRKFTIPEFEGVKECLGNKNRAIRNAEFRKKLLYSVVDIAYTENEKGAEYYAGPIGRGVNTSLATACRMRKVEAVGESKLFFSGLLPLMGVTFVRNGQLTVLPFPFKYINEYCRKIVRAESKADTNGLINKVF